MSLQIIVAHTGQRLQADPVNFDSVDALKTWVSKATQIPVQDQILLTSRSKHVKSQAILTEKEIFVYDRDLFNLSASQAPILPTVVPESYAADDPPDTLTNQTDLKAWQTLFKERRDWGFSVLQEAHSMSSVARRHFADQTSIDKSTRVAVGNHDTHINNIQQKSEEARTWFEGVSQEINDNLRTWERDLAQLEYLPAKGEFRQYLTKGSGAWQKGNKASLSRALSLKDFLDIDAVQRATTISKRTVDSLGKRLSDMGSQIEKMISEYNDLLGAIDQSQSRSNFDDAEEPMRLLNEIEVVAKKVDSDYEHVMGLPTVPKSVAQVSKMALLHTRNYLPAIKEYSAEMSDIVRRSVELKNASVQNAVDSMRRVATIESNMSHLNNEIECLNIPSEGIDAFELVSLASRLPFVYGTLLVEAVRRREWVEKMKKDTSALAEEMAGFQEEEERRRKRWLKPIGDLLNIEAVSGDMLGFEMNVQGQPQNWPTVSREDLHEYLKALQSLEGLESSSEPLNQAIKDLDKPTKQQVKRAKNFKMGSVHEPAFGKGSLMLRGDDEMRVLKEVNSKLEEDLRGSKSRVRKLEDLLHRQSHVSRLSIGSGFQPGPQSPADPSTPDIAPTSAPSPRPQDELSRRSSVSSRRFSSNQGPEDKLLTRHILKLEAELATEKEARSILEKTTQSRNDTEADLKRQIEDANSTKRDLMANMDAKQKEFSDERRALEEELANYKARIEELEDDLDQNQMSRVNERTDTDTRFENIRVELEHAQRHIGTLESSLQERQKDESHWHIALRTAFQHLSSDSNVPTDQAALISQIEEVAHRSANQLKDLQQAIAIARFENDSMRTEGDKQQVELMSKLESEEKELASLREHLEAEKAKATSTMAELEEERHHLQNLRARFAEGETGSEILRQRVAEEEAKVGRLATQLAQSSSHANSLDVELLKLQKKYAKLSEVDTSRIQQTSSRAKNLSQRLYAQHERLLRLLEALGFVITYEDDAMVIQRASKVGNSTVLNDPNGVMNRSVTTPSPIPLKKYLEDYSDLLFLQWSETTDPEEENKRFTELISTLDRFNVEMFSEAVWKRQRDMEHTARKWQKEARAYRDKAHRFQSEAHEKIAFRSFKEGDLALFLPTRNQATRPWAAFNVGAPHYFLREQDSHRLHGREWLVARISKVEERVVDLSKTMDGGRVSNDGRSITSEGGVSFEDDNPFELSDGLRWYLLEAAEEKVGAPSTPGLGKTTVASANVDARGSIRMTKKSNSNDPAKTLGKRLDSRRSSAGSSRKSVPAAITGQRSGSSEAIAGENAEGPTLNAATRGASPNSNLGHGPSHLRTETQASGSASAAPNLLDGTDEGGTRSASPYKSAIYVPGFDGGIGASASASKANSPSQTSVVKAHSPASSPSKRSARDRGRKGVWDSLWQLDISYQSGKAKK